VAGPPALDERALLDLVGEIMGLLEPDEFRQGIVVALKRAVPSKFASLNEITRDGAIGVVIEPDLDRAWHDLFATLAGENPLYRRYLDTADGRAYRFSDVTSPREFRKTRIYREFYAPLGVEHQIAFTLPSGNGDVVAVALSRGDPDYSDAERDFLNRARPYLIQAYRNALTHRGLPVSTDIERALAGAGLTPRETAVVAQVALGRSNRDAAQHLGLSDRTVQKHLQNAFRKLGVKSRSAAAAWAWERAGRSA
jgi:DNA-binding CsgD family transcriptional regulator